MQSILCPLPEKISLAHAVLGHKGREVFVGGFEARHIICRYNLENNTWSQLDPCPVTCFGIAYFRDKLISVGGVNEYNDVVSTVYEYNREVGRWEGNESRFPSMPTARSTPTVVTRHGSSPAIAACGGLQRADTERKECNTVEVYSSSTWHTSVSLPRPLYWTNTVTIHDQCYLLGGRHSHTSGNEFCYSISLDSLMDVHGAEPNTPHMWEKINEPVPMKWATAARFGDSLVAIGGRDDEDCTTDAIHVLTSEGSWNRMQSLALPEPRERTAAITTIIDSHWTLIIFGGSIHTGNNDKTYTDSVFCISTSEGH